jgi:hypothetical protein
LRDPRGPPGFSGHPRRLWRFTGTPACQHTGSALRWARWSPEDTLARLGDPNAARSRLQRLGRTGGERNAKLPSIHESGLCTTRGGPPDSDIPAACGVSQALRRASTPGRHCAGRGGRPKGISRNGVAYGASGGSVASAMPRRSSFWRRHSRNRCQGNSGCSLRLQVSSTTWVARRLLATLAI